MVGGIGLMGTVLTMVGLYGLVSYSVARRTREIGIRMAVGATYGHVLRMILRQGMTPAWFGVVAGVILSIAATRLMPTLFPTSDRYSPATFLTAVPRLAAFTLAPGSVPPRGAAGVDRLAALGHACLFGGASPPDPPTPSLPPSPRLRRAGRLGLYR